MFLDKKIKYIFIMKHKEEFITEEKVINTPAGGVLIGKDKDGQTIIPNDGSLGGFLVGRLHKDGGIKAVNKGTGQPLEMQSNEIVITAPAVADTTKREFEGKMMTNREILSKINSDGGGVSFADGGDIPAKIHTTDCEYKFGGKVVKDADIAHSLGMNSTLKKGKQQFSSGDTTYDVDAIYNAIKKGKLRLKTKEVETFPMKYPVYDKKYSKTVKTDFRKPNGITVLTESGEEVLIDGNHRMNNAYLKGKKTMKTYYIEDPKQISKFSKKNKFELGGENKVGGHLSSGKSLKQIAEMHNVSLAHINEQLAKGLEVEKEHFADFKERTRVAKDHLVENPNYYTILAKAGLKRGGKIEKEDLVKDAKDGNTPARDLNNYNDLMDVQADGEVGGDSGIEMDGALVTGDTGAVDAFAKGGKIDDWFEKPHNERGIYNTSPFEVTVTDFKCAKNVKNKHNQVEIIKLVYPRLKISVNYVLVIKNWSSVDELKEILTECSKSIVSYGFTSNEQIEAYKRMSFANGGEVNDDLWQSVKDKFSEVFWEEDEGDEIYANEVKAEERVWIFDRYSPYKAQVGWEDAKNMFLKSLTDEEKKIVNIEYNLREVSEAFGLMWEKKILVKRKKKLDEIDNLSDLLKFVEGNYANGGLTPYDANTEGDSVDIVEDDFAKGGVVYDTTKPTVDKITIKETKFDGDSNLYSGLRENIVGKEATNISYFINLIKDYVGQNPLEETDWLTFYVNDGKKGTYYIDLNKGKKNTVKNVNPKTGGGDDIKRVIDANKYLAKNYNWTEFFYGQQTKKDNSVIRISVTYDSKVQGASGGLALKNNTLELYELLRSLHIGDYVNVQIQPIVNSLGVNPVLLNLNTFSWDNLLTMSPQETALKEINRILYGLFPELNFDAFVRASSNATTSQTTTSTSNNDNFVDVVTLDYQLDAKNYFSVSCRNLKELLEDFAKIEYYCVKNPDATISVEITAEVTDNTGRITAKKERINIGKDAFKPSNFSYDEVKYLIQGEWFDNQLDFTNFFKTNTTAQTPTSTTNTDKDVQSVLVTYAGGTVYTALNQERLKDKIVEIWKDGGRSTMAINLQPQGFVMQLSNPVTVILDNFSNKLSNTIEPSNISISELKELLSDNWFPELVWSDFFNEKTKPATKEKVMFLRGISNKLGADVSNVTELRKYIEYSYLADDKQKGKVTLNVGGDSSKGTFYISYGSTFSCSTCFDIQTDGNKRIQEILLSYEGADKFDWSDFFQEEKIIETGVSDLGEAIKKLEKASSKVATEYNRDAYDKSLKFLYDTKATYELALKFTPESAFMYERLDILKKLADLEKSIKKIEDMKKGGAFYMLAQILEKLQRGENWRTSENAQDVITNQLPQSEIDVIIRSQKFKNWFGDWEKALVNDEYDNVSKALTDGVPSVYHHGARRIKYTYREVSNGVLYLAENISYAIWFSQNSTAQSEEGNYLTDCFVNIKNPIDLTTFHVNQIDLGDLVRYIDAIYPLARIYDFIPAQVALLIKTNQPTNVRMWAWQLIRSYAKFVNHIKENTPYDGFLYYENNPSDQVINPVTGQSEENVTKAVAIFKSHQVKVVDAVLFDGGLDDWRFENGGKINN